MRAQLQPLDGGKLIEIIKDMTLVGRKEDCDLRIDHKSVSKQHCIIVRSDGGLLIRDLGSTNGTRVNGQRVRRAFLLPNDQLQIASFVFKIYLGPGEPPALPQDHTLAMDGKDVADVLKGGKAGAVAPRPNPLPDVYPEDNKPPPRKN